MYVKNQNTANAVNMIRRYITKNYPELKVKANGHTDNISKREEVTVEVDETPTLNQYILDDLRHYLHNYQGTVYNYVTGKYDARKDADYDNYPVVHSVSLWVRTKLEIYGNE